MKVLIGVFSAWFFATSVVADTIKIDDGAVTFESPKGFTALTNEEISVKFPSSRAPQFVVGNEKRSTTIAYDIKPNAISENDLPELKKQFTQVFDRIIPGIEWKKNEIIDKEKRKWIYFEMTSRAIDTDIYNIMLVTPYKEQMLMFNFNSTKEQFPKYEKELRKSMDSIKIHERKE